MRGVHDLHGIRGYDFLIHWGIALAIVASAGTWAVLVAPGHGAWLPAMAVIAVAGAYFARFSLDGLSAEVQRLDTHLWIGFDYLLRWVYRVNFALAGVAVGLHLASDILAEPTFGRTPGHLIAGCFGLLAAAGVLVGAASHRFRGKARDFALELLAHAEDDGMTRIELGLRNYLSPTQANPAPIVRGVGMLHGPRKPFYDPDELPFLAPLVKHFDVIRAELEPFLAERRERRARGSVGFKPYFYGTVGKGWETCLLHDNGKRIVANTDRCPETTRLVEAMPGYFSRHGGFLLLEPGASLAPHRDPSDLTLNCHLGLMIPKRECGIRLGPETRCWRERELLIFDTSYEHNVWNNSDELRVILQVTFFRPELTQAEQDWWSKRFWGIEPGAPKSS